MCLVCARETQTEFCLEIWRLPSIAACATLLYINTEDSNTLYVSVCIRYKNMTYIED